MSKHYNRVTHPIKAKRQRKQQERNLLIVGIGLDTMLVATTAVTIKVGVNKVRDAMANRALKRQIAAAEAAEVNVEVKDKLSVV